MIIKRYSTSIVVALILLFGTNASFAELKLPSGNDRRPNLSLDPFERARESMRTLPSSDDEEETIVEEIEATPPPEPEPVQQIFSPPPIVSPAEEETRESAVEESVADSPNEGAFFYEFAATLEAFSITAGGVLEPAPEDFEQDSTGVYGVLDFTAEFDTGAADFWNNGLLFLYSIVSFGTAPAVGDLHGLSGVYAGGNTLRIVEAWYQHSFPYSKSSVLFGLHDMNSEFYVAEYADIFVNGSFGMGTTIGIHGNASTYPVPTLGLRFKSELTEQSYFQIALYDGASTETAFDKIAEVKLDKNEGVFAVAETGLVKNHPGSSKGYYKLGLGSWYSSIENEGFENTSGTAGILADDPKPGTYGVYLLAETSVGQKLGLFFKHGRTRKDYNQFSEYYSTGMNFTGAIPGRELDVLGVGLVHTRHSDAFLAAHPGEYFVAETSWEITYTTQIADWLMIQPDFQYIQQPSMSVEQANTILIGLRIQAVF